MSTDGHTLMCKYNRITRTVNRNPRTPHMYTQSNTTPERRESTPPHTSRTPNGSANVPHPHGFVPARARGPALAAKQAPVDAGAKLGVAVHDAHEPAAVGAGATDADAGAAGAAVGPHADP